MIERTREIEQLSRKYRAIGPLLTKMEGLIAQTNTGRSPKLLKFVRFSFPLYIYALSV